MGERNLREVLGNGPVITNVSSRGDEVRTQGRWCALTSPLYQAQGSEDIPRSQGHRCRSRRGCDKARR